MKGKLIVLCGKSGSGKSTLAKYMSECGVSVVKPYTTRIKRGADDTDYNFVSHKEFFDMYADFTAIAEYETEHGVFHYGFKVGNLEEDTLIILNPKQINKFKHFNPIVVYLDLSNSTLLGRLAKREDSLESARRFLSDVTDFKHIQHVADIIVDVENNLVEDIVENIALKVEEIKNKEKHYGKMD